MAVQNIVIFTLVSLVVVALFAAEFLFFESFWLESGINLIKFLQGFESEFQNDLFFIVEFFTFPIIGFVIALTALEYKHSVGMELLLINIISFVINHLIKVTFSSPSPCWLSIDIHCIIFVKAFAEPSLHIMLPIIVLPYAVYRTESSSFWYFLIVLFEIFIIYFRLYSGLHTYSQIILSLGIGIYLCYIFITYFHFFAQFVELCKKAVGVKFTVAAISAFFIWAVVFFYFRKEDWNDKITMVIKKNSENHESITESDIRTKEFYSSCEAFLIVGGMIGFFFSEQMAWNEGFMPILERILRDLIVVSVFHAINFASAIDLENVIGNIVFKITLTNLQGFLCFGGLPWLWNWVFNNDKPEDDLEILQLKVEYEKEWD